MDPPQTAGANWSRRLLVAGVVVAVVLGGGLIASATIPRWWAQHLGDQIEGSIVTGTFVGLFYGFVFTALPFLVLAAVMRWRRTVRAITIAIVVAVRARDPEPDDARHRPRKGERGTRRRADPRRRGAGVSGASLAGALIALAMGAFVGYLIASRERARETDGSR